MLLAAGATSDTNAVVNGLFGAQYSVDGKTFKPAKGGGGQGQDVKGMGKNSFGIAGAFGGDPAGGVAISTDGGASFTGHGVGAALDATHPVRYASYPTADTWFVSAGSWPSNSEHYGSDEKSLLVKQLSELVQLRQCRVTGKQFYKYIDPAELREKFGTRLGNITSYNAAIAKTTDGGKTFTKVFQKDNACMYFNDISCSSADHCIAGAEGHNCATPGAHFYVTNDGGKTWNATGSDAGGGAMGVKMVNEKEGWVAGGGANKIGLMEGRFFHTTDGGATWNKEIVKGVIGLGLDCGDADNCVATAVTNTQQATVVYYK